MNTRYSFLALALVLLTGACTQSVHQVAVGGLDDIPHGAHLRPIEAEVDQKAFLAAGNTRFADAALAQLAGRCPRGRVVAIQARYSTNLGFLAYTNRMKMTGYCLEEPSAQSAARSTAPTAE